MKKVFALTLFLLLFAASGFAATFGPAESLARPGKLAIGTGVFVYSADWENDVDVRQNMPYVQIGLGIAPTWEIYTQLGIADIDLDSDNFGDREDGYRPFASLGVRGLFTRRGPVSFGAFLQGTYFSDYEDGSVDFEKGYEVNGGVVLQAVLEGATLYGGPVFYLRDTDVKTPNGTFSVEEDSNFGGFIGIRWPLKNNMAIELETQIKTSVSVGGAIHFIF